MWAFGCTLFELLTLQRPFKASSLHKLSVAITGPSADDEHQAALLAECQQRAPPVPGSLLALPTQTGLLCRDPKQRLSLVDVAAVLDPLLEDADHWMMLDPYLPGEGTAAPERGDGDGHTTTVMDLIKEDCSSESDGSRACESGGRALPRHRYERPVRFARSQAS